MSSFATHQFAPVRTYDELARQPGYVSKFNPAEDKVDAVLFHYVFVAQCQCGISRCRQHHNEGFVVKLESGLISHVGHHCWKRKFKEIGDILNRYQEEQELPRLIAELMAHKAACKSHRSYISNLKDQLLPLVERKARLRAMYPQVFAELATRADRGGQYQVVKVTERLNEAAKSKSEASRRSDDYEYSQKVVGVVKGCEFIAISALGPLVEAERIVERVEKSSLIDISFSKLHSTTLEASTIDTHISRAKALLEAGKSVFARESAEAIRQMDGSHTLSQEARNFDLQALDESIDRKSKQPKKSDRKQRESGGWSR